MDDIVKALTDFSVDGETNTDDLAENEDIIKALTDLSAISDVDITTTLENDDTLPTTNTDQNNVVTISYTQVNTLVCTLPWSFINALIFIELQYRVT